MSRAKRTLSGKILIGFFPVFILVSCNNAAEKGSEGNPQAEAVSPQSMLVGTWEAEWNTPSDAYPVNSESMHYNMNGKLHFYENGTVKIVAYGYNGCIFMSDTMANQMRYELTGDTISLLGEDEDFGLPYRIMGMEPERIELLFLENIAVTLTR